MTTDANERSSRARSRTAFRRYLSLILIAILLVVSSIRIDSNDTVSTAEFHTILETLATVTVAFATSLAFLRYYARKHSPLLFLFLATGLFGTCVLDAVSTIVTSDLAGLAPPEQLESLIPWSWNASRLLYAAMMLSCWIAVRYEMRHRELAVPEWMVYGGAGILLTAISGVFARVPAAYFDELWIPRPQELPSGLLCLIVTIAFWRLGRWRRESIQFWILCSVLISSVGQLMVMSRSSQLYDAAFNWAHILKICSYLAVLMGLLIDIYRSHRDLDRTAERLQINEERFALAAQGSHNGLWDWEVQSNRVWYAPRFWHLLGYTDERLPPNLVESFNQHLHPDDYEATWNAVDRHLYHGDEVFDIEYRMRHLKLGYRWYRARGIALRNDEGVPIRMSGSIQDITESKLAESRLKESSEALERSNDELQQFASVASHDLQEPLRAVIGYCDLLKLHYADKLDDDGRLFVQFASDGAKRMQQLIDSLLNLSRVQTHGRPFEETDLNAIVDTALENLSVQIRETSAEICVETLPQVVGDETQLTQLFQNLLSNAIKFHKPDERPKVDIRAESHSDEWLVSIQDNGIGVQAHQSERIFTVFQRLHSRDEYEGTGIGLAICKKVVERHQGRIWTEPNDQGSKFLFTISKHLTKNDDGNHHDDGNGDDNAGNH